MPSAIEASITPAPPAVTSGGCVVCNAVIGGTLSGITEVQASQFKLSGHCPKCWRERYLICPCGSVSPYIDMTPVRVGLEMTMTPVCLSCFSHMVNACHRCGRPFHRLPGDNASVTNCPRCRNFQTCELCTSEYSESEVGAIILTAGMKICKACLDRANRPAPRQILANTEKVHFLPLGDGPGHIGVEIEVEVMSDAGYDETFYECHNLTKDFCIIKKDGTLARGFEIVSRPMTFIHHKAMWDVFLEKRPACLRSYDTKTCGMHIHYSKKALTSLQLGKILVFVNDPNNRSFIVAMAGREPCEWSKMHPKKIEDATGPPGEKYQAVNILPKHTVEFRLFKGTLNRKSFLRNIEFVHAIIHFFKPVPGENQTVGGVPEFSKFVADHQIDYPNLNEFIEKSLKRTKPITKKGKPPSVPGNMET